MKNKWWVILGLLFLGVIFLSLAVIPKSQEIIDQEEQQVTALENKQDRILTLNSWQAAPIPRAALAPAKKGITIISAPTGMGTPSENIAPDSTKVADKATNNITGTATVSSTAASAELESAGITKNVKMPPTKEAKEMNSRGIVLY